MRQLVALIALFVGAAGCGITPPPPCMVNESCPGGQFCQHPEGQCGAPGTCAPIPGGCFCQNRPTVGCDGNTYNGGCSAAEVGVSVDHYDGPGGTCP